MATTAQRWRLRVSCGIHAEQLARAPGQPGRRLLAAHRQNVGRLMTTPGALRASLPQAVRLTPLLAAQPDRLAGAVAVHAGPRRRGRAGRPQLGVHRGTRRGSATSPTSPRGDAPWRACGPWWWIAGIAYDAVRRDPARCCRHRWRPCHIRCVVRGWVAAGSIAAVLALFDATRASGIHWRRSSACWSGWHSPCRRWPSVSGWGRACAVCSGSGAHPLFLFGGAFYPLSQLPPAVWDRQGVSAVGQVVVARGLHDPPSIAPAGSRGGTWPYIGSARDASPPGDCDRGCTRDDGAADAAWDSVRVSFTGSSSATGTPTATSG